MWDIPRYQIRAYLLARQRQREAALESDARPAPKFRFRKLGAILLPLEAADTCSIQGPVEGSVFLHEVGAGEVRLFANEAICVGQRVALSIEGPQGMYLCGVVVESTRLEQGRVISANPQPYRLVVRPEFDTAEEYDAVRRYCREILPRFYMSNRAA